MRAINLNWDRIRNFSVREWPDLQGENVLNWMDARVITDVLIPFRQQVWFPVIPSIVAGAHVRHDNSGSLHSTRNKTKLSTATDFFIQRRFLQNALTHITNIPAAKGIGFVFNARWNGELTPMIHVDIRNENRLFWLVTRSGDYVYLNSSPRNFFLSFANEF